MYWLEVGQIVNTHGIKGEVRVISQTDFPEERFKPGSVLYVGKKGDDLKEELIVRSGRPHKNFWLVAFEGYPMINDVEHFKKHTLYIHKDQVEPIQKEGVYYHHDILNCKVVSLEGEEVGTVSDIFETGANDVWEVTDDKGKKHYLPVIRDVIKDVNIEEKVITIDVLEGLLS